MNSSSSLMMNGFLNKRKNIKIGKKNFQTVISILLTHFERMNQTQRVSNFVHKVMKKTTHSLLMVRIIFVIKAFEGFVPERCVTFLGR